MVPEAGLEPAHPYERGILNPLCLPISPPGQEFLLRYQISFFDFIILKWSGKRGSNSRPQPWQGCALPLSYSRNFVTYFLSGWNYSHLIFICKEFLEIFLEKML